MTTKMRKTERGRRLESRLLAPQRPCSALCVSPQNATVHSALFPSNVVVETCTVRGERPNVFEDGCCSAATCVELAAGDDAGAFRWTACVPMVERHHHTLAVLMTQS